MERFVKILILIFTLVFNEGVSQNIECELFFRPALTSLRGNEIIKTHFDHTVNLSAGIGTNYFIKENSIVNINLLLERKGGTGSTTFQIRDGQNQILGEEEIKHESEFYYLTIPAQWGKRFGEKVKYQIGIGFYTGYLIKQLTRSDGLGGQVFPKEDNTGLFKRFDFGFSASLDFYIPVTDKHSFRIGFNDYLGLFNTSAVPVANDGSIKHNSLGVTFGINFKVN